MWVFWGCKIFVKLSLDAHLTIIKLASTPASADRRREAFLAQKWAGIFHNLN
jgi:hypothetical protein